MERRNIEENYPGDRGLQNDLLMMVPWCTAVMKRKSLQSVL